MPPSDRTLAPADRHDTIEVRGARENNLRNVSLDLPKRRLTVFTGVSGSGKSSLVFGTIAAESRRLIDETYTAFVQSFMPSLGRPDVDALRNLSAAIIVDQERMGANARSTVGTATDAHTMLRIVFSRIGEPHVGTSSAFSFNNAEGMCPECEGLGRVSRIDVDELLDRDRSLNEGAITVPNFGVGTWYWKTIAESGLFDPDARLRDYTPEQWEDLLHKPATKIRQSGMNLTYEGLVVKVQRLFLAKERESMQPHIRAFVDRAVKFRRCPACDGARLNEAALSCRIDGRNIAECAAMQISDLAEFVRKIDDPSVGPVLATLRETLDSMVEIGLGYLSLDRESATLSGGESQRVKMVRHLGSSLTDVTYVFDEPTVGLHPTPSWSSSTSPRSSRSPTTWWTSAPARARRAGGSATPATWRGSARPARSPGGTSATAPGSATRCARTGACCRSPGRACTTSRTSASTCRWAC